RVYWRGEGSGEHASWNGARLQEGHCAVDPKKIPYGSKVVFPDATCVAADSGPGVVSRKAARLCGLGKNPSTFHGGANSNARNERERQTRCYEKSRGVTDEYRYRRPNQ